MFFFKYKTIYLEFVVPRIFFISSYTFPKGQSQVSGLCASKDRFFLSEFVTEISLNPSIKSADPAKLSTKFCQISTQ